MDKEIKLVTQVTLESGKVYFLYSDGNLYTREDEKLIKLDNITTENKKIIEKIMELYKPAKTDVIDRNPAGDKIQEEKANVEVPEM